MLDQRTVKIAAALVVSTFLSSPALAQVATAPVNNPVVNAQTDVINPNAAISASEVTKFDTVTVVATKTPQSTFTFPGQVSVVELGTNPGTANSQRLSSISQYVPGLNFYGGPRSNGEVPQLRGFGQKGVIVTVDGKKQSFDSVHDGRFFIDPQLVKKVEVVKGPSSALYGSGGLGGVVALETKDAADIVRPGQNIGYETSVGFNSANMEVVGSQIAGIVGDNYDALAAFTGTKGDDIRLGDGGTAKADSRILSGLAKLGYRFNDTTSIKLDASTYFGEDQEPNNPQAGPRDATAVNKVDKSTNVNQFGAKLNYDLDDNLVNLNTHLYYTETKVEERLLQNSSAGGSALNLIGDVLENEIQTLGFTLDNTSKASNHTLTYGVEYVGSEVAGSDTRRAQRNGVPNAESTIMGAFLQDEIRFAGWTGADSSFYIVPAARFDSFSNEADNPAFPDQDETHLSPKIAATYEFTKNYNVFASWAEAFRAPTLQELYLDGTHFPTGATTTNVFLANPNLKPETAQTFEVGFGVSFDDVIQSSDRFKFKASRFQTKAKDYIDQQIGGMTLFPPPGPPFGISNGGYTTFNNVDEAKIWGYEATADYLSDSFRAMFNLAYAIGKDANTGTYLGTNDAFKVKTDIAFTIPNTSTEIGYLGKYALEMDKARPSAFTGALAGYSSYDAINFNRGGYAVHGVYTRHTGEGKFDGFVFDLGLDNIFDKRYAEAQARNYEIGRSLFTRVTYKW